MSINQVVFFSSTEQQDINARVYLQTIHIYSKWTEHKVSWEFEHSCQQKMIVVTSSFNNCPLFFPTALSTTTSYWYSIIMQLQQKHYIIQSFVSWHLIHFNQLANQNYSHLQCNRSTFSWLLQRILQRIIRQNQAKMKYKVVV